MAELVIAASRPGPRYIGGRVGRSWCSGPARYGLSIGPGLGSRTRDRSGPRARFDRLGNGYQPSIARTLHQLLGKRAEGIKPLSFSPAISAALEELHWPAAGQTSESTEESILEFFSSPHFLSDTRNSD